MDFFNTNLISYFKQVDGPVSPYNPTPGLGARFVGSYLCPKSGLRIETWKSSLRIGSELGEPGVWFVLGEPGFTRLVKQ